MNSISHLQESFYLIKRKTLKVLWDGKEFRAIGAQKGVHLKILLEDALGERRIVIAPSQSLVIGMKDFQVIEIVATRGPSYLKNLRKPGRSGRALTTKDRK